MTNARDFNNEIEKMIDRLMVLGLIEITGIDSSTGEFLYKASPDLYEAFPELESHIHDSFLNEVNNLWVKGFLKMDVTQLNPMVTLTPLAFDEEKVKDLTLDERNALMMVMNAMRKD